MGLRLCGLCCALDRHAVNKRALEVVSCWAPLLRIVVLNTAYVVVVVCAAVLVAAVGIGDGSFGSGTLVERGELAFDLLQPVVDVQCLHQLALLLTAVVVGQQAVDARRRQRLDGRRCGEWNDIISAGGIGMGDGG